MMKSHVAAGVLVAGAVSLLSASQAEAAMPTTVTLGSPCSASQVTGFVGDYPTGPVDSVKMRQFIGIPYAAPPTGANRWQPPKPVTCWSGNRDAKTFGASCPTANPFSKEDCLFLNVFTPNTASYSNLPVMVWIHGGALTDGCGNCFANPLDLVKKGVIVVSINYRLGALGFLAHKALNNVVANNTGNYGIQDQIAALQWVKANISKFGGNPNNVTLFGQSAGGLSIEVLLISPLSVGLFHKAISQSSPSGQPTALLAAQATGATFAKNAGCGTNATAQCLRSLSVAKILENQAVLGRSTALVKLDNKVLTKALSGINFRKLPIMKGITHDEQRFHLPGDLRFGTGDRCHFVSNVNPGNYSQKVALLGPTGNFLNSVVANYPGSTLETATTNLTAWQSDRNFICPARRASNAFVQSVKGKLFLYEFNEQKTPTYLNNPVKLSNGAISPMGAAHGADVLYLFRASIGSCGNSLALTASQKTLSAAMVTYWTTFAKSATGDPNPPSGLAKWPAYTGGVTGQLMSLTTGTLKTIKAPVFDTDHKCSAFWDQNSGP